MLNSQRRTCALVKWKATLFEDLPRGVVRDVPYLPGHAVQTATDATPDGVSVVVFQCVGGCTRVLGVHHYERHPTQVIDEV